MEASALCPDGKGVYREATDEELEAAYRAEFGDGPPVPIATFHIDKPEDVARLKAALNPFNLSRCFGPDGAGMAAFEQSLKGEQT
ncbi:MAG: hypothetical protein C0429_06860 [Sphingopyxis sp.]|nr:hypothetical protein [Sphingopyxis sp.]